MAEDAVTLQTRMNRAVQRALEDAGFSGRRGKTWVRELPEVRQIVALDRDTNSGGFNLDVGLWVTDLAGEPPEVANYGHIRIRGGNLPGGRGRDIDDLP